VDGLHRETTEVMCQTGLLRVGDTVDLCGETRGLLGRAVCSHNVQPLFVSAGHRICLDSAVNVVLRCCQVKTPEPIRAADLGSREAVRQWKQQQNGAALLASAGPAFHARAPPAMQCCAHQVPGAPNIYFLALRRTEEARARMALEAAEAKRNARLHVTYLCDCSASMGRAFKQLLIPACEASYTALRPNLCDIVLFGKEVTTRVVHSAADVRALASKPLEGRTNIGRALDVAADLVVARMQSGMTHMLVLASDGQDTANRASQLQAYIDTAGVKIKSAGAQTLVAVVGIGASSDTRVGMRAKEAMQTIKASGDESAVFYARATADIPAVVEALTKEQVSQRHAMLLKLSAAPLQAAPPGGAVGCGFIRSVSEAGAAHTAARLTDEQDELLFMVRGDPDAAAFALNGQALPVRREEGPMPLPTLLQALDQFGRDISVASGNIFFPFSLFSSSRCVSVFLPLTDPPSRRTPHGGGPGRPHCHCQQRARWDKQTHLG
jgi:hypothetical protein